MTIYIVMGETGKYSERELWLVKAFKTKESAIMWTDLCNADAKRWEMEREKTYRSPKQGWSTYDPNMQMDYTGTVYDFCEIEMAEDL